MFAAAEKIAIVDQHPWCAADLDHRGGKIGQPAIGAIDGEAGELHVFGIVGGQEKTVAAVDKPRGPLDPCQMGELRKPQSGDHISAGGQIDRFSLIGGALQNVGQLSALVIGRMRAHSELRGVE